MVVAVVDLLSNGSLLLVSVVTMAPLVLSLLLVSVLSLPSRYNMQRTDAIFDDRQKLVVKLVIAKKKKVAKDGTFCEKGGLFAILAKKYVPYRFSGLYSK